MKQVNYLKRVQGLLVLLMLAFAAPMLTACGSDDDEPEGPHPIVGEWKCINREEYDSNTGTYYDDFYQTWYEKFDQNGTFVEAYDSEITNIFNGGSWKITGNRLTMTFTYDSDFPAEGVHFTFTLTGDRLVIIRERDKVRMTYERVK